MCVEGQPCRRRHGGLDKETTEPLLKVLCIVSRAATGFASTKEQRALAAFLLWPGLATRAQVIAAEQC